MPSPDHKRFAVVSDDDYIRVFTSDTHQLIWEKKLDGEGQVVAWPPDGETLATAARSQKIHLFNSRCGKELKEIQTESNHTPIVFTKDEKMVISGSSNRFQLHETETGKAVEPELGKPVLSGGFENILISNDGLKFYAHNEDEFMVTWHRAEDQKSSQLHAKHAITALTLSKDGKMLAVANQAGFINFHPTTLGATIPRISSGAPVDTLTFGRSSDIIIIGGQQGRILGCDHWLGAQKPSL